MTMDYEKAYNDMVQRAKELHDAGNALTKKQMEIVCPELAKPETEDERARRELIEFISSVKGIAESGRTTWAVRESDIEMCSRFLAWIEKQKDCSGCAKHLEGYISGRCDAENKLLEQFGAIITPEGELHVKPRWKPSDEMMEALDYAITGHFDMISPTSYLSRKLEELYDRLKNL